MLQQDSETDQILYVSNFQDLLSTPFHESKNAICFQRQLSGNFLEILNAFSTEENIRVIEPEQLAALSLSPEGNLARACLLEDFRTLQEYGAAPVLNFIRKYEEDSANDFFPTDVYSFHIDRSPFPGSTFLCTYAGAPSEILPNKSAVQKILIPEIRKRLHDSFSGSDAEFEAYLIENFYDLHYQPLPLARTISLGKGNLWRLSVDCSNNPVPPCIHRAPREQDGESRLLLIC